MLCFLLIRKIRQRVYFRCVSFNMHAKYYAHFCFLRRQDTRVKTDTCDEMMCTLFSARASRYETGSKHTQRRFFVSSMATLLHVLSVYFLFRQRMIIRKYRAGWEEWDVKWENKVCIEMSLHWAQQRNTKNGKKRKTLSFLLYNKQRDSFSLRARGVPTLI